MNKYLKTYQTFRTQNKNFTFDFKEFETFLFPYLKKSKVLDLILYRSPSIIPYFFDSILKMSVSDVILINRNFMVYVNNNPNSDRKEYLKKLNKIELLKIEIKNTTKPIYNLTLGDVIKKYGKETVYSTFEKDLLIHYKTDFVSKFYHYFPEILHDKRFDENEISKLTKQILKYTPNKINELKHFLNDHDKKMMIIHNPSLMRELNINMEDLLRSYLNYHDYIEYMSLKSNDVLQFIIKNKKLKSEIERVFNINLDNLPKDIHDLSLYDITDLNHILTLLTLPNSFRPRKVNIGTYVENVYNDSKTIDYTVHVDENDDQVKLVYEIWDKQKFYYSFDFNMDNVINDDEEFTFDINKISITNKNNQSIVIDDKKTVDNLFKQFEYVLEDQISYELINFTT